jgi:hypothetical protein
MNLAPDRRDDAKSGEENEDRSGCPADPLGQDVLDQRFGADAASKCCNSGSYPGGIGALGSKKRPVTCKNGPPIRTVGELANAPLHCFGTSLELGGLTPPFPFVHVRAVRHCPSPRPCYARVVRKVAPLASLSVAA